MSYYSKLFQQALLKAALINAIELVRPTPDDKYLIIDFVDGEVPGKLTIETAYHNRRKDDEGDTYSEGG